MNVTMSGTIIQPANVSTYQNLLPCLESLSVLSLRTTASVTLCTFCSRDLTLLSRSAMSCSGGCGGCCFWMGALTLGSTTLCKEITSCQYCCATIWSTLHLEYKQMGFLIMWCLLQITKLLKCATFLPKFLLCYSLIPRPISKSD